MGLPPSLSIPSSCGTKGIFFLFVFHSRPFPALSSPPPDPPQEGKERTVWSGRPRILRAHLLGYSNHGLSVGLSLASYLYPRIVHSFGFGGYKSDWTKRMQGKSQIFGLLLSLAMALVGGIIVGE